MSELQKSDKVLATVESMFRAYCLKWGGGDIALGVETEFCTRLPKSSWRLAGKIDGYLRIDGKLWLIEHKTASKIDASYLDRLPIDQQITLYAGCGPKHPAPLEGVIYDIAEKSTLRGKEGETREQLTARMLEQYAANSDKFHRVQLPLYLDQIQQSKNELLELVGQIKRCERNGRWYRNTDYCFDYQRACPYVPLCATSDPTLKLQYYEPVKAHSELSALKSAKNVVSASSLKTFIGCRRKYYWRYIRELQRIGEDREALWIGSLFHQCLERWLKAPPTVRGEDLANSIIADVLDPKPGTTADPIF